MCDVQIPLIITRPDQGFDAYDEAGGACLVIALLRNCAGRRRWACSCLSRIFEPQVIPPMLCLILRLCGSTLFLESAKDAPSRAHQSVPSQGRDRGPLNESGSQRKQGCHRAPHIAPDLQACPLVGPLRPLRPRQFGCLKHRSADPRNWKHLGANGLLKSGDQRDRVSRPELGRLLDRPGRNTRHLLELLLRTAVARRPLRVSQYFALSDIDVSSRSRGVPHA